MDFFDTVRARRSVRHFTDREVPDEVVEKAVAAALIAPNSSNMQPWEFYWVRTPELKQRLVTACFSQSAAGTAKHLLVAVARVDTWRRNRDLVLANLGGQSAPKPVLDYYTKVVPLSYAQGPFNLLALPKWIFFALMGLFRPAPRRPVTRADLFEVVTKTTALACENLMLAITAQGFASCPMEGFDECRVKRVLGIGRHARVVMVLGIGEADPKGRTIPQFRIDPALVFKRV
jgi:nitroreductase